ncbi:hypothetical protein WJX84_011014 [Apatococcus fuscideae]|uniref:Uncharacterized protein n=1 Tax=Apatococcus fuscideae TaxID=2026836 RepID=A0AAW1T329_9CHLO
MHAAARQTASLQQDITAQAAHSTSWASRCHARTEPRTAITFSQALQAEPCQNATPRPTQSKTIKDCRLGRAAIRQFKQQQQQQQHVPLPSIRSTKAVANSAKLLALSKTTPWGFQLALPRHLRRQAAAQSHEEWS